jgi:hypothetical protein
MSKDKKVLGLEHIPEAVNRIVNETTVLDMHTHLYSEEFGSLGLWGLDELLTYHYLVAEFFRTAAMPPAEFWLLEKGRQAELIWQTLFVENTPLSEATRGVLTVLQAMGLEAGRNDLNACRDHFRRLTREDYTNMVFRLAGVKQVVMTNDPFDPVEREIWRKKPEVDPRFKAVLRLDPLLMRWGDTVIKISSWGYAVQPALDDKTCAELRRFLEDWIRLMRPVYMAVSLPPEFGFPENSARGTILQSCVLPVCREQGLPFAMMIGVRKEVNPHLRLAGDSLGRADVAVVERLCEQFQHNRFLATLLSLENQHALCVAARKFSNLLPFGCWWFLNNPSLIEAMTRMRVELLGTRFIPQHSDARILDQLLYKWAHSRKVLAKVLADKYSDLCLTGWPLTEESIRKDVFDLFEGNFSRWIS